MYAVKLAKLRIPDDVAIFGFSDGELARACDPMLSTVEQHGYDMGRDAARLLIDKIKGVTHGQYSNKIVKTNLIIRESTL
jgi:LacI family transcriptional regulator